MKLWRVTVKREADCFVVAATREDAEECALDHKDEILDSEEADASAWVARSVHDNERGDLPWLADEVGDTEHPRRDWTVAQWLDVIATEAASVAARTDAATVPLALPYPDGRVERVERVTLPAPEEVMG